MLQSVVEGGRRQAERTIRFIAIGPFHVVYPLFGPVREAEWAPGWSPLFVHPAGGSNVQPGTVFLTKGHETTKATVWIMTDHDPHAGLIRYVTFRADHSTAEVLVKARAIGPEATEVTVTYRRTSLSREGDRFVNQSAAKFERQGPHWAESVNRYLAARSRRARPQPPVLDVIRRP